MKKKYEVGEVVTGKVTGIQPYGAFVALDESTQGLVHISEITYGYVRNVEDFFKVGDIIQVKILDIDERNEKISLSTRALQDPPPQKKMDKNPKKTLQERVNEQDANGFQTLKEKLQDWIERGH
ncbi:MULTISPECIES: S1 domain-containing post-transcriptional regulator GSP13 [Ureibacillus]|jgi:general stress protein 13|uniref:General stress protein 13 n=1 Tax=Ureibacillus thermosphaericus TaxID=51173 RepID=A0A840PX83_URETH|nr:S1 domain-containing post-transcriptional regulator GSP13 [Ureibacillus thermosphaericus]MBB5150493.1 general stress protein 13 [Ureibacillus thermosphaericus]NKZ33090.1 general stress protein 13 [Ureibacillus thermosphaericus]